MPTTKITSDQLTFKSANTGEHLLDTYLENTEVGGKTLAQIVSDLTDANGDFDIALLQTIQFRLNPLDLSELQVSFDGVIWTTVGNLPVNPGSGDMVSTNNLGDVASAPASRTNLGLGALATLNSVNTAQITDDAVDFAKLKSEPTEALTLYGKDAAGDPAAITVGSGVNLSGTTLTGSGTANYSDVHTDGVDYTSGTGLPVGFPLPVDPQSEENLQVFFDGVEQVPDPTNYTFNATTITFTNGIPALVNKVRVRISV